MDATALEDIRSVLVHQRDQTEDDLAQLDAAISQLDALIDAEQEKATYHERVQTLRSVKAAL